MNAIRLELAESNPVVCPACRAPLELLDWVCRDWVLLLPISPPAGGFAETYGLDGVCPACQADVFGIKVALGRVYPGRKRENTPNRHCRAFHLATGLAWSVTYHAKSDWEDIENLFGPVLLKPDEDEDAWQARADWRLYGQVRPILDDLPRPQGRRPSRWWPRGIRVR